MAATPVRPSTARLVRRPLGAGALVELDVLAREAGLHPDLVARFVQLGLLEQRIGADSRAALPARRGRPPGARFSPAARPCSQLRRSRARQ